jgi:ABC-type glycerol-3-phosphate transport system substrate-binding protein
MDFFPDYKPQAKRSKPRSNIFHAPAYSLYIRLVLGSLVAIILTGCPKPEEPKETPKAAKAVEPDPLTALVIDDTQIGEALARQWLAQSNGQLRIINRTTQEWEQTDFELGSDIDVAIYPVGLLGELESRQRIIPLAKKVWMSSNYNKEELLRIFRSTIPRHRNEIWGVPLGGAMLTLVFDQSVADRLPLGLPTDWEKLKESVSLLKEKSDSGSVRMPFRMPLAKGWAAEVFLARVASSIRTRGRLSTVFDRNDMRPLIDSEPFRIALEDLKYLMGEDRAQLELDPAALFQEILDGRTLMGITWPTPSDDGESRNNSPEASKIKVEFASLPGSDAWFDNKAGQWNQRSADESRKYDLVGFNGLLGSTSAASHNASGAFEFLAWLGNKSTPLKTMVYSSQSGPFRASHLGNPSIWFTRELSDECALRYADVLQENHDRDVLFMFPRIPGRRQYLTILDENIRDCLRGDLKVDAALSKSAQEWNALTDKLGREKMIRELAKDGGL